MSLIKKFLSFRKKQKKRNAASRKRNVDTYQYNNEGYYVASPRKKKNYQVTVVMPVYNAEETLTKSVESVINQSIGFENVELIIIDDQSTDSSWSITLNYAEKYNNVVPVILKNNTGSPATPRNVGINLARGKYITFLDSDDWFSQNGLDALYMVLEKTGDNYAIGGTVKISQNKTEITGEYNSCMTRESITPYSIPHLFQHLGPTARMIRTSFIKENNFRYPNMKYAEDKQFFIDVLLKCPSISTIEETIYYVNRLKENKSLTTTTSIFEKTDTNIKVIKYVLEKNIPQSLRKMILNRLYEFDCITRLFNRHHFLNSKNKELYFRKFAEVLETTKHLNYDFTDNFFEPWHKVLVNLYREKRYDDIITLINWSLNESVKETIIKDGLPYYHLPFDGKYQFARISMLAYHKFTIKNADSLFLHVNIYGNYLNHINSFVIRQRNNELNQIELPINKVSNHEYKIEIPYKHVTGLSNGSYATFIKYNTYRKLFIKMDTRKIINYDEKKIDFYTTIGDNLGIAVK